MNKGVHMFITGTDTGVGKTRITSILSKKLSQTGHTVITQKWVQTGAIEPEDLREHDRWREDSNQLNPSLLAIRCPYIFPNPVSPHVAAKQANQVISIDHITLCFKQLSNHFDHVVVEGAGGTLVPLTDTKLLIDVAIALRLDIVVVSANRVGAINHTLLTVYDLQRRGASIMGIVWNNLDPTAPPLALEDNPTTVARLTGLKDLTNHMLFSD